MGPEEPHAAAIREPVTGFDEVMPTVDRVLADPSLELDKLTVHWAAYGARRSMTAEEMKGADRRAQRLGIPSLELMEEAGTAVAAAARAILNSTDRPSSDRVLILGGPGNNGGDAFAAARRLADFGIRSFTVLVAGGRRPGTPDAIANWDRLDGLADVELIHAATGRAALLMLNGVEKASLVIDGLLGTGMRGHLREPVHQAVELCLAARLRGVPILAIDTPTALDLSTGAPSVPNVRAHVTVTFHRPKVGLQSKYGRAYAGRVLVAPIGIPREADVG